MAASVMKVMLLYCVITSDASWSTVSNNYFDRDNNTK